MFWNKQKTKKKNDYDLITQVYRKAILVANSCTNEQQFSIAKKYALLSIKYLRENSNENLEIKNLRERLTLFIIYSTHKDYLKRKLSLNL